MRRSNYITVLIVLGFIFLGLGVYVLLIPLSAPRASFTFDGYTNDSGGKRLAVVTIVNEDRFPIRFVSVGAYIWFDNTPSPVGANVLPRLEGTELLPGKSQTFRLDPADVELPGSDVKRSVEIWVRRSTTTENLKAMLHRLYWRIPAPSIYGLRSPFIIE